MAARSMYFEPYLNATEQSRVTVATFLHRELRGKAKQYSMRYQFALIKALGEAVDRGEVRRVSSVCGAVSYVRAPKA
jgi:hypothetical protein